jgi:pSer/pThr/pTyr-binding forkhead associated (FHA) protein
MKALGQSAVLAKLSWQDPETGEPREVYLSEGGSVSIGRLETNTVCIKEQHVSRQHAAIEYRAGVFVVSDLGSANGVYVNDARISAPYPLLAGDVIRLYVPTLYFDAVTDVEERQATEHGAPIATPVPNTGRLIITDGAEAGTDIPLIQDSMTVGRATSRADWDICLSDPAVSRPHARLDRIDEAWVVTDLGSANGTLVNGTPVNEKGRVLRDGDTITFGATPALFRSS